MKNSLTQSQLLTILCGGEAVKFTLLPMTFLRLFDINLALGGKDLGEVLQKPTPFDLATITYCLLDDESKKKISDAEIELGGKFEKTNDIHKLICLMADTNVTEGLTNFTAVLQGVLDQVQIITTQENPNKKKDLDRIYQISNIEQKSHIYEEMFV